MNNERELNDLVKKAEQNLLNICKEFEATMKIVDALSNFGNSYCHEYVAQKEFFDGIKKIRNALANELAHSITHLFLFSYIGGDESKKYAYEKFKERFSEEDRQTVIHFLDKFGQIPNAYSCKLDEEFRKQAKEKMEKFEDKLNV